MRARASIGALCLLAGASATNGQKPAQPVFGVSVESVYFDVFVTNGGRPVPGLAASDFELKDDGVTQRLEIASADSMPLLVILAFDTSGSLAGEKLRSLRAASQALLESLKPEDEVALFTFAEEFDWWVRPTRDRARVTAALQKFTGGGGTAVVDAVYAAMTLPASKARTLVVVFTDGEDNMSWLSWREVQGIAEKSNAYLHVVSLKRGAAPGSPKSEQPWAMCQIAEATGGRCWEAASPAELRGPFSAIAEAMNKRYVLRYEPTNVKGAGWHAVDARLRGKKGDLHARRGYWVVER
jgi:VWFA-related protein